MEKVFDNVRAYDFFGIWGAGIISLTYGFYSVCFLQRVDPFIRFKDYLSDYSLLIIFSVSVLSYLVGSVLHEIGKWFYDCFVSFPRLDKKSRNKTKKCNPIKRDFYKKTNTYFANYSDEELSKDNFDSIVAEVKKTNMAKVIDRYHALYGLTRGILIGLCFNILVVLFLLREITFGWRVFMTLFVDLALILIFIIRTYRYYLGWIRNTFAQHCLEYKKTNQGTVAE